MQVSDASPRPASPLVAFLHNSPLGSANSTASFQAVSLSMDMLSVPALGTLSPVSPAMGLSATALVALSSHSSSVVRPSAPALKALPSISPASSALHASAPALRALFSPCLADWSVLQSAPALRALSSLNSVGAVSESPAARPAVRSVGEWTGFQTPPSIALAHMPSPLQAEPTTPSPGATVTPAKAQLLSHSAARDFVQSLELVLPDLSPPPPLVQSDDLTHFTDQTRRPACSQVLSAAKLSESCQTAASAGLLLTGGTSSGLRRSPGPATDSPSPARLVLSSSPVAGLATSKPRIPVRQTKKQKVGSCHVALLLLRCCQLCVAMTSYLAFYRHCSILCVYMPAAYCVVTGLLHNHPCAYTRMMCSTQ